MDYWQWIKNEKLSFINLVGSIASIIGFAIVIIGMFVSTDRDPEIIVWQYILFFLSLFGMTASVIFTYVWIKEGIGSSAPVSSKNVFVAFLKLCVGVILLGLGADAAVAAVRWKVWLWGPISAAIHALTR
jgi:hypothetical protein